MKILQGIDLVKVVRIEAAVKKSGLQWLRRVFTVHERAYCDSKRMKFEHYAARYAAKEAVLKALKIKPRKAGLLAQVEIKREATGKPFVVISPKLLQAARISAKAQIELSIAHEREYAIATVVIVIP